MFGWLRRNRRDSDAAARQEGRIAAAAARVQVAALELGTLIERSNATRSIWSHRSFGRADEPPAVTDGLWVRYGAEKAEWLRHALQYWVGDVVQDDPSTGFLRLCQLSMVYANYVTYFRQAREPFRFWSLEEALAQYELPADERRLMDAERDWYNRVPVHAFERYLDVLMGVALDVERLLGVTGCLDAARRVETNAPARIRGREAAEPAPAAEGEARP